MKMSTNGWRAGAELSELHQYQPIQMKDKAKPQQFQTATNQSIALDRLLESVPPYHSESLKQFAQSADLRPAVLGVVDPVLIL